MRTEPIEAIIDNVIRSLWYAQGFSGSVCIDGKTTLNSIPLFQQFSDETHLYTPIYPNLGSALEDKDLRSFIRRFLEVKR